MVENAELSGNPKEAADTGGLNSQTETVLKRIIVPKSSMMMMMIRYTVERVEVPNRTV